MSISYGVMLKGRHRAWEPSGSDYEQVFSEQNPWHATGVVPEELARPVERPLAQRLWERLLNSKLRRYQIVVGPRRVGKSTSMYQTVRRLLAAGVDPNRLWWLRLDHPLLMRVPLNVLVEFALTRSGAAAEKPVFLFLDELTYADAWDKWLKTFYDDRWPVQLVGTSSSTPELRQRRPESGVGRWDEQYLTPYLFDEYLSLVDAAPSGAIGEHLRATIDASVASRFHPVGLESRRTRFTLTGGFPELLIQPASPLDDQSALLQSQRVLRSDAVERAVYKDIPQAVAVQNPALLERMLYVLAGQVGGILSPQSLCGVLSGMTQPTFDRYLRYLEQAFLVFTTQNYASSEESKQRRGRKLYFTDGAVRNAALQRGVAPLGDPAEMGLLRENLAAAHLHALCQHTQVRLYHWRDGDQFEVDLIYDHPTDPVAFEIASGSGHSTRGLQELQRRFPRFRGGCYLVSNTPHIVSATDQGTIGTLPIDAFLLLVGQQAGVALSQRLSNG